MQRPLQTHNLIISSRQASVTLRLPPTLLHKIDSSHHTSWKVWINKVVMPSYVPNIFSTNNAFVWNGVKYALWPGKASAMDITYQLSSVGCVTKWSHVDNRFIFQCTGDLDLSGASSCATILGLERKRHALTPDTGSTCVPELGLLDYVVVSSSLANNTHMWSDGDLKTNTNVLCTMQVNDGVTFPYEDAAGDRAVYYHSSLIDAISVEVTSADLVRIPELTEPWHCSVTIAEVTDVLEAQLSTLNKSTAELLDLKKMNTILKHGPQS